MLTAGLSVCAGTTVGAMPLPFLASVGASEWPDAPTARRALASALRALPDPAPARALAAWAFAREHVEALGGAPVPAVCALLGISRATLFAWRAADPEVAKLPTPRVKRRPGAEIKGDTRAAREARKGQPRGRRPKPRVEPVDLPAWVDEELGAEVARWTAHAPAQGPAVDAAASRAVTAYDGAATDAEGLRAALATLGTELTPGEASAVVRAVIAARVSG